MGRGDEEEARVVEERRKFLLENEENEEDERGSWRGSVCPRKGEEGVSGKECEGGLNVVATGRDLPSMSKLRRRRKGGSGGWRFPELGWKDREESIAVGVCLLGESVNSGGKGERVECRRRRGSLLDVETLDPPPLPHFLLLSFSLADILTSFNSFQV